MGWVLLVGVAVVLVVAAVGLDYVLQGPRLAARGDGVPVDPGSARPRPGLDREQDPADGGNVLG